VAVQLSRASHWSPSASTDAFQTGDNSIAIGSNGSSKSGSLGEGGADSIESRAQVQAQVQEQVQAQVQEQVQAQVQAQEQVQVQEPEPPGIGATVRVSSSSAFLRLLSSVSEDGFTSDTTDSSDDFDDDDDDGNSNDSDDCSPREGGNGTAGRLGEFPYQGVDAEAGGGVIGIGPAVTSSDAGVTVMGRGARRGEAAAAGAGAGGGEAGARALPSLRDALLLLTGEVERACPRYKEPDVKPPWNLSGEFEVPALHSPVAEYNNKGRYTWAQETHVGL
jgi:hypothetical protein